MSVKTISVMAGLVAAVLSSMYYLMKLRQECGTVAVLSCATRQVFGLRQPLGTADERAAEEARNLAEEKRAAEEARRLAERAAEAARKLAEEAKREREEAERLTAATMPNRAPDAPAVTTSYSGILGRWCGDRSNLYVTNLDFGRESFSVTWRDTNRHKVNKIIRYEFSAETVRVHWLNGNAETWTEYGEFSRDGQRMLQLSSQAGPTYVFWRC